MIAIRIGSKFYSALTQDIESPFLELVTEFRRVSHTERVDDSKLEQVIQVSLTCFEKGKYFQKPVEVTTDEAPMMADFMQALAKKINAQIETTESLKAVYAPVTVEQKNDRDWCLNFRYLVPGLLPYVVGTIRSWTKKKEAR